VIIPYGDSCLLVSGESEAALTQNRRANEAFLVLVCFGQNTA